MNTNKMQHYENLLKKQLEELQNKDRSNQVIDLAESEQISDFTDQATLESGMDINIHLKERDSRLISKTKAALERIKDGTYGICEECGEDISEKRLKARPVTTVCIDCKENQENHEKLRGE